MGHAHDVLKTAQIALVHSGNGTAHRLFVAHFGQRKQPVLVAVPEQHAHFVLRPQRIQHPDGAVARDLVAVHELHPVHDQHHRAGRQNLFAAQLHVHGQCFLQRRSPIAPRRVGLVAANANQPHAEIANGALQQFHQRVAQIARGDVAQKNAVVTLYLGESAGEFGDVGRFHLQVRRLQRGHERGVFVRFGGHEQDARVAADGREIDRPVVLRHGIARRFDLHFVIVKIRFGQRLRKREEVLSGLQLDRLFTQQMIFSEQPHRRPLRLIGLSENLHVKCLSLLDVGGQGELLH